MRHVIAGRRYKILFNARLSDSHGLCTDPARPRPIIKIARGLSPLNELEALIHEALHASAYQLLSESYVTETAHDIATLLTKTGYSKHGKETA